MHCFVLSDKNQRKLFFSSFKQNKQTFVCFNHLLSLAFTLIQESRQDHEQGGGAGLSLRVGQSCALVVPQQLLLGHCLCDFVPHSLLKQQLVKYTSCFALAESPPQHYCSGGGWRSLQSLRVGARGRAIHVSFPLTYPPPLPLISLMVSVDVKHHVYLLILIFPTSTFQHACFSTMGNIASTLK